MSEQLLYRLSWEMPAAQVVDEIEQIFGTKAWPSYDFDTLTWHRIESITERPFNQYHTLKDWAAAHTQPIRNVRLEQLAAPPVWLPADDGDCIGSPQARRSAGA